MADESKRVEQPSNRVSIKTWAGPGSGKLCSGCSKVINFDETEIEVELPATLKSNIARFHVECYRIWSGEADS